MSTTERTESDDTRLRALLHECERAQASGDHRRGAEQAAEAVELAERLGHRALAAEALLSLGMHRFRLGENEACLSALHRALALFTELEDLRGQSSALNGMVMAYHELGLQEDAMAAATRSLEAAKESKDPLTLAWAYNRAGLGHAAVGNIEEGLASMEFALNLAAEAEDQPAVFSALNNLVDDLNILARKLLDEGRREEAQARIRRALELAPQAVDISLDTGNRHSTAIIMTGYGQALALDGQAEKALEMLGQAEELAQQQGYRPVLLEARHIRARLQLDRGETGEAIEQYRSVLDDAEAAHDGLIQSDAHWSLYRAHKERGEYREALAHHEAYYELEREQQSQLARTRARILSSHLELDRAQLEARRATLEAELERSRTRQLEAQARALRQETEALTRRADEDGLTGLWNRRYIEHELPRLLEDSGVRDEWVSIAFVDADHFKSVNDRFGHLVGDDVLRHLAEVLRANVRPTDVVARLGGEEFVVLLPGAGPGAAVDLGQRLCDAVRGADWSVMAATEPRSTDHVASDGAPNGVGLTVSVGVAACVPTAAAGPALDAAVATLLRRADAALYEAKRAGRDRVVLAEDEAGVGSGSSV